MQGINAAVQNVTKAIQAEDFDAVSTNAGAIVDAFLVVEKYWTGKSEDAVLLAQKASKAAADLRVVASLKRPHTQRRSSPTHARRATPHIARCCRPQASKSSESRGTGVAVLQSDRRSRRELGTNALNLARSDACQGRCDRSHEWPKILHPVGTRPNHHDAERKSMEVVLIFELAIHRQDASTLPAARRSNSPFLTPAHPSPWTVPTSRPPNSEIRSWGRFSSSRTRTGQQGIASEFERGNRLTPLD
jgi:hypothetical protein